METRTKDYLFHLFRLSKKSEPGMMVAALSSVLKRLRQEDGKFKARLLGYTASSRPAQQDLSQKSIGERVGI